jgi:mevalonate kinase
MPEDAPVTMATGPSTSLSPTDTSTSCHGRGVFVDSRAGEGLLWHIQRDVRQWFVHDCQVPRMTLVVGYTGIHAPTGPLVAVSILS